MKVSDIMQTSLISVAEDAPLKEVARLIFSLGIAGVPVIRDKKLVGMVTEQDILGHMYPSMRELVEDYVHARDFEQMEKNLEALLALSAKQVMNKHITTAPPTMPLMEAQSLMLLHKFSRLPIVDKENNLLGIVSQGDIFRQLLKDEIPQLERERYAGFIAEQYDLMVNWEKRFPYEFPALFDVFRREKIKTVIDVGSWTGEYSIHLAKEGLEKVVGLDNNHIMTTMSNQKRAKLPESLRSKVRFVPTDYKDIPKDIKGEFDAAICMGNSLPYVPVSPTELFKQLGKALRRKHPIVIVQLLNFEKILRTRGRLLSFSIQKSTNGQEVEHLFIEFFDKKNGNMLAHHVVMFGFDGKNWIYKGITTVDVQKVDKEDIERALRAAGFLNISFSGNKGEYQGEYGHLSFVEPFDPLESDWLNVVARR